jgi:hypothetical protein
MRGYNIATCAAAVFLIGIALGQSTTANKEWIEYDRRLAENYRGPFPAAGIIPDAATAELVAQAIAIPIWGKKIVESELPLRAGLKGNAWTVLGDPHLHGGQLGGELIIQLDKRNGAVLKILHTQ